LKIRIPELEILVPTIPVKNYIRNGDFFKIIQTMETGAEQGQWTWQRYGTWLESKRVGIFRSRRPAGQRTIRIRANSAAFGPARAQNIQTRIPGCAADFRSARQTFRPDRNRTRGRRLNEVIKKLEGGE